MAFKTTDFKKTTRASDGGRQLYPYQIRDDRYTAAIGYAIAYFERMVGKRRGAFETDTLLEFFGDPRLARGLVACLSRTYAWREQSFSDAFGEEVAQTLWRAGLANPAALRRKLYGLANGRYGGVILPHERAEALDNICQQVDTEMDAGRGAANGLQNHRPSSTVHRLSPEQFERGMTLDAEENHVLVKLGPTPTPEQVIAGYNYHSLETALCHAEALHLHLRGPVWSMVRSAHNLARRYRLRYRLGDYPHTLFDEQLDLALYGARDALGNWSRSGRRLVRALLRLLAAHPDSVRSGEALVHLGGQSLTLKLDERALRVLGVAARDAAPDGDAWEEESAENLRRAWSRALLNGQTAGWRLRRDPEPIIGTGVVVVPDFSLQRGQQRVALCLAAGRVAAEALVKDIGALGQRVPILLVVPEEVAMALSRCPVPMVNYAVQPAESVRALVKLLERSYPRSGVVATLTPWQRLEQAVAEEGFVGEAQAAALLGCPAHELAQIVQRWGGTELHVLPGLGICAPGMLDEIRQMIEENAVKECAA